MNIEEACAVLGVNVNTPKDEVKKTFRKLAAKFHPDNKDSGSEAQFKKINEANQVVESYHNGTYAPRGGGHPNGGGGGNWSSSFNVNFGGDGGFGFPFNIEEFFGGGFGGHRGGQPGGNVNRSVGDIKVEVELSFAESVLGCKKDIAYDRNVKCGTCGGMGKQQKKAVCKTCAGSGTVIARQGNVVVQRTCHSCNGSRLEWSPCGGCNSTGGVKGNVKNSVKIPAGVANGNVLRIEAGGHFAGVQPGMELYTNLFVQLKVQGDPELKLSGKNVVSTLNISLLEALQGTKKEVKTVQGQREIVVPPLSKNRDEVTIRGLGVPGSGNHNVVLEVSYPQNVEDLVRILSPETV